MSNEYMQSVSITEDWFFLVLGLYKISALAPANLESSDFLEIKPSLI